MTTLINRIRHKGYIVAFAKVKGKIRVCQNVNTLGNTTKTSYVHHFLDSSF